MTSENRSRGKEILTRQGERQPKQTSNQQPRQKNKTTEHPTKSKKD